MPCVYNVQFLEIAVGDIMAAPVWHSIELQAMRELHLVRLAKLLELLASLSLAVGFLVPSLRIVGRVV
jgi:hypothetical protein